MQELHRGPRAAPAVLQYGGKGCVEHSCLCVASACCLCKHKEAVMLLLSIKTHHVSSERYTVVSHLQVNKMDDPSILNDDGTWSKERYDEIVTKLTPFLRSCGYNPKKDIEFLPMSGLLGHNIKDPVPAASCLWYKVRFEGCCACCVNWGNIRVASCCPLSQPSACVLWILIQSKFKGMSSSLWLKFSQRGKT